MDGIKAENESRTQDGCMSDPGESVAGSTDGEVNELIPPATRTSHTEKNTHTQPVDSVLPLQWPCLTFFSRFHW